MVNTLTPRSAVRLRISRESGWTTTRPSGTRGRAHPLRSLPRCPVPTCHRDGVRPGQRPVSRSSPRSVQRDHPRQHLRDRRRVLGLHPDLRRGGLAVLPPPGPGRGDRNDPRGADRLGPAHPTAADPHRSAHHRLPHQLSDSGEVRAPDSREHRHPHGSRPALGCDVGGCRSRGTGSQRLCGADEMGAAVLRGDPAAVPRRGNRLGGGDEGRSSTVGCGRTWSRSPGSHWGSCSWQDWSAAIGSPGTSTCRSHGSACSCWLSAGESPPWSKVCSRWSERGSGTEWMSGPGSDACQISQAYCSRT